MDRTISPALTVTPCTLDSLTADWQDLLSRAGNSWPFLRPAWLRSWLNTQAPDTDLLLLAVQDGQELQGIVPLLRRDDRLQFAGDSGICDYMDVIALPGLHAAVFSAALAFLGQESWAELVLWGLRADSPTLSVLPELAAGNGLELVIEDEAVCPRIDLPSSWEDYLLSLSKKDRHELRRKMRRMMEAGSAVRDYDLSDPNEIRAAMPDFLRLHRESRQDKAEFMTEPMERFFVEMTSALAQEDLIRLFFLEIDGRRVASVLAFNCGDELWLYNSGFDPAYASASVGLASKAFALQRAIEAGRRCYDFLRGAEPYKYDLGAKDFNVVRATLRRPVASSGGE